MKEFLILLFAFCSLVYAETNEWTKAECSRQNGCSTSCNIVTIPVSNRGKESTMSEENTRKPGETAGAMQFTPSISGPAITDANSEGILIATSSLPAEPSRTDSAFETVILYTTIYADSASAVSTAGTSDNLKSIAETIYLTGNDLVSSTVYLSVEESSVTVEPVKVSVDRVSSATPSGPAVTGSRSEAKYTVQTVYLPQTTSISIPDALSVSTVTVEPVTMTVTADHASSATPSILTVTSAYSDVESTQSELTVFVSPSPVVVTDLPTVTVTAQVVTVTPVVTHTCTPKCDITHGSKYSTLSQEHSCSNEDTRYTSWCYHPLPLPPKGDCRDHYDRHSSDRHCEYDYCNSQDHCKEHDICPDRAACDCPKNHPPPRYGGRYRVKGGRAKHLGQCRVRKGSHPCAD